MSDSHFIDLFSELVDTRNRAVKVLNDLDEFMMTVLGNMSIITDEELDAISHIIVRRADDSDRLVKVILDELERREVSKNGR